MSGLLKLDFVVSARSIRRYRRRPRTRPPSQSWRTFLINQAGAIWAADLFVVQTPWLQDPVRVVPHQPRSLRAPRLPSDFAPGRRLDVAAVDRGHGLGSATEVPDP